MNRPDDPVDVAIVGYGPVGQLLAVLLAQRGWAVTVVERWPAPYPMPRAVAFDGECARILAGAGIGPLIDQVGEPSGDYAWRTADGRELLRIEAAERYGHSGWPDSTSMYQPGLEAALTARGMALPGLRVLRGRRAVRLDQRPDAVELVAVGEDDTETTVTARWVVGCDGANSFVRDQMEVHVTDYGFEHDWLICDVVLDEPREFVPNNLQVCDPARPRTAVSAGPGHRRWEFMRMPGETVAELNTAESAWKLLGLFDISPANARLERFAVYTFRAGHADGWRAGRCLIAGDAAHVMPPFAGQGMSSGFRDAANLAWKLDLVLSGRADAALLDSYAEERRRHVQHAITMSVSLGRVICQTDPAAARDRDTVMLAAARRPQPAAAARSAVRPLTAGMIRGGRRQLAGTLLPQGRVARPGGEPGLFDDVLGRGFVLLSREPCAEVLDTDQLAFLDRIGTQLVRVVPGPAEPAEATGRELVEATGGEPVEATGRELVVTDVDDRYLPLLERAGAVAVLVRPDCYAFGDAETKAGVPSLVDDLRTGLSAVAGAS